MSHAASEPVVSAVTPTLTRTWLLYFAKAEDEGKRGGATVMYLSSSEESSGTGSSQGLSPEFLVVKGESGEPRCFRASGVSGDAVSGTDVAFVFC